MRNTRREAGRRSWTPLVAVVGVAGAATVHGIWPTGPMGGTTLAGATLGASLWALWGVRSLRGPESRPWRWMAYGLVVSAGGDVIWALHEIVSSPARDVIVGDVAWIASYLVLAAALFELLRVGASSHRDEVEGVIDTGVAVVTSGLVLWQVAVQPGFADIDISPFTRLVWSTYPTLDAVLLALVLRAALSRRVHGRPAGRLLAGVAAWLMADLAGLVMGREGIGLVVRDTAWMGGALILALAIRAARTATTVPSAPAVRPVPAWRTASAHLVLLVPPLADIADHRAGGEGNPALLVVGTSILAVLMAARTLHLLREREAAEKRMASSDRYFRALAANSSDAMLVLDPLGRVLNDSPVLADLVAAPGRSVAGLSSLDAVVEEDRAATVRLWEQALAFPGRTFQGEVRINGSHGRQPWLSMRVVNLLDDPDVAGIVVNLHEITDRKEAEAELRRLAFQDGLTGLANRGLFYDRVEHRLEQPGEPSLAVLFLDLDRFKEVNDGFGHDAGDELLRAVAGRLDQATRGADTVARLGGDEFAILIEGAAGPMADAELVAERILELLAEPVLLPSGLVTVGASIGIALAVPGATASELLRDADMAMYEAKAAGRGRWCAYDPSMRPAGR